MEKENLILIESICIHHNVQTSFFVELENIGLLELYVIEESQFIHQEKLSDVEKMIRLHHELGINPEGIDVIFNLLQKIDSLENELNSLKNKASLNELFGLPHES